jgi:predicted secreted protein
MIQSFLCASIASANSNLKGDIVLLNKQDNRKEINVRIGEVIRIELERYASTGYEWYPDKSYGEYLELIGEGTEDIKKSHAKGMVGAPVRRWWELRAFKKGEAEISIYLYRDWEGREKSVDSFKIKVKIL